MGKKRWRKPRPTFYESGSNVTDYDPAIVAEVESLFQKQFTYSTPEHGPWSLPPAEEWFTHPHWTHQPLQACSTHLNQVKSQLSDVDINKWHEHTGATNRAGTVLSHLRRSLKPELCTQAWCKFYEIAATFPWVVTSDTDLFTSLHLCEAPGAFVTSLNHFLKTSGQERAWQWRASTLNPYFEGNAVSEMVADDRFICDTLPMWYFGNDDTGDVMKLHNIHGLHQLMQNTGPVHLVTADGSIDCQNTPEAQETVTSHLHLCEVITALHILSPGGSLVIKMFTLFEASSVCLMYLLNCVFQQVNIFKPATSKSGNSEVYVICKKYKTLDTECMEKLLLVVEKQNQPTVMFGEHSLPDTYLEQHRQCCTFFKHLQVQTIEENCSLFQNMSMETKQRLDMKRSCCAATYQQKYRLKPLPMYKYVVPPFEMVGAAKKLVNTPFKNRRRHIGSYHERQEEVQLTWPQRLASMVKYPADSASAHVNWLRSTWSVGEADIKQWSTVEGMPPQDIKSSRFCDQLLLNKLNLLIQHHPKQGEVSVSAGQQGEVGVSAGQQGEVGVSAGQQGQVGLYASQQGQVGVSAGQQGEVGVSAGQQGQVGVSAGQLQEALQEMAHSASDTSRLGTPQMANIETLAVGQSGPLLQMVTDICQDGEMWESGQERTKLVVCDSLLGCCDMGQEELTFTNKLHLLNSLIDCLKVVEVGQHMLVVLPGIITRFSAGLFFILHSLFKMVSILPSSGQSSREYVACVKCRGVPACLLQYLSQVSSALLEAAGRNKTILQTVPVLDMYESNFFGYLSAANDYHIKLRTNHMIQEQQIQLLEHPS